MLKINLSRKIRKDLKNLKRKFRNINKDLDDLFFKLSQGFITGNKLQEFKNMEIYKARVKNSSGAVGKSGGFRVIYYLKRSDEEILVLTIYSKSIKTNIPKQEILEILKQEN